MKILVTMPQKEEQKFAMSNSHHISCFKLPRKLSTGSNKLTIEEFVEDHLLDGTENGDLLSSRKEDILNGLHQAAGSAKGGKKKKGDDNDDQDDDKEESIMDALKAAAKVDEKDAGKEPAKKKAKKKGGNEAGQNEFQEMLSVYKKHWKKNLAELKDILRWNNQMVGGTKDFLLFKVIDGELHGRLGLCPLCQGDLKFEEGDFNTVHCRGRYDEDIGRVIPCSYTAPRLDSKGVKRCHPWYVHEPSEEEKEGMKKEREEGRGEAEGMFSDNPVAQELLKAAESLEIDLSTNPGKKKAAADFVALVEGKVDLPENRSKCVLGCVFLPILLLCVLTILAIPALDTLLFPTSVLDYQK
jgi:hypothetical protein